MSRSAKLGQNFLHDKNIAAKIVNVFLPQPGPVLEIGPGPGILSALLLENLPAAKVTLVEVDRFLAQELRQRFGAAPRIIQEDILKVELAALYPQDRVAVIGNLPYHISKPLIDWFIIQYPLIAEAVLMLQKDFVDKLLAAPGGKKYNAQSVVFQLLFQARRRFDVPAGAFAPKPKIVSTVITARPLTPALSADPGFYPFVRMCFTERRKTLWNNLSPRYGAAALTSAFAVAAIPAQARAEQLSPPRFADLWNALAQAGMERVR